MPLTNEASRIRNQFWRFSCMVKGSSTFPIIPHCTNKLTRNQHPSEFRTLCSHADNGQQTSGHERVDGQRTTVKFSHTDFPFFRHSRLLPGTTKGAQSAIKKEFHSPSSETRWTWCRRFLFCFRRPRGGRKKVFLLLSITHVDGHHLGFLFLLLCDVVEDFPHSSSGGKYKQGSCPLFDRSKQFTDEIKLFCEGTSRPTYHRVIKFQITDLITI